MKGLARVTYQFAAEIGPKFDLYSTQNEGTPLRDADCQAKNGALRTSAGSGHNVGRSAASPGRRPCM